jgi:hypothetical protein
VVSGPIPQRAPSALRRSSERATLCVPSSPDPDRRPPPFRDLLDHAVVILILVVAIKALGSPDAQAILQLLQHAT